MVRLLGAAALLTVAVGIVIGSREDPAPPAPSVTATRRPGRATPAPRVKRERAIELAADFTPPSSKPTHCSLPPRSCDHGDDLVAFVPPAGPGYEDVPLADEQTPATSTSYVRRDLRTLVQYAAAKVACEADSWSSGIGGPIALGDMSDVNGDTPGTLTGSPRHLPFTHAAGRDIDIAYFQIGTPDNHLRAICDHVRDGIDVRHCTTAPETLDVWRTALFIGAIFEEPRIRIVIVDGRAGPVLQRTLEQLCKASWVTADACTRAGTRLVFEVEDTLLGLYHAHHNHLHVSWKR
jgi:hypothetical protein